MAMRRASGAVVSVTGRLSVHKAVNKQATRQMSEMTILACRFGRPPLRFAHTSADPRVTLQLIPDLCATNLEQTLDGEHLRGRTCDDGASDDGANSVAVVFVPLRSVWTRSPPCAHQHCTMLADPLPRRTPINQTPSTTSCEHHPALLFCNHALAWKVLEHLVFPVCAHRSLLVYSSLALDDIPVHHSVSSLLPGHPTTTTALTPSPVNTTAGVRRLWK